MIWVALLVIMFFTGIFFIKKEWENIQKEDVEIGKLRVWD